MKIEFRQFVEPLDAEFRLFVSKGQLTAISQLHHLLYFSDLKRQRKLLEAKLQHFHRQVRSLIKPETYFLDCVVSPGADARVSISDLKPLSVRLGLLFQESALSTDT